MIKNRKLDGERLLKMKKQDFLDEGMESWLALTFVQWVRDLKYDVTKIAKKNFKTPKKLEVNSKNEYHFHSDFSQFVSFFGKSNLNLGVKVINNTSGLD